MAPSVIFQEGTWLRFIFDADRLVILQRSTSHSFYFHFAQPQIRARLARSSGIISIRSETMAAPWVWASCTKNFG